MSFFCYIAFAFYKHYRRAWDVVNIKVGNLWLAVYHSYKCEPHASNFGGYISIQ